MMSRRVSRLTLKGMFLMTMAVGMISSSPSGTGGVPTMGGWPNTPGVPAGGGGDALWLLKSDMCGEMGLWSAPGVSIHCYWRERGQPRSRQSSFSYTHAHEPQRREIGQ
jgi:hypothetical protein